MQNNEDGNHGRGQYQGIPPTSYSHPTSSSYPSDDSSQPFRFYQSTEPSPSIPSSHPFPREYAPSNSWQGLTNTHAAGQRSSVDAGGGSYVTPSPHASGSRLPAAASSSTTEQYYGSRSGRSMITVGSAGAVEDEGTSTMMEEDEMADEGDHDEDLGHDEERDEDGLGLTGRPAKRPRQTLKRGTACVNCRVKKLKCTGERPICSVCANSKKPVECVYETFVKKKPKVQRLRTKVQQLEDQIKQKEEELRGLEMLSGSTRHSSGILPRGTTDIRAVPLPFSTPLSQAPSMAVSYDALPGVGEVAGYGAAPIPYSASSQTTFAAVGSQYSVRTPLSGIGMLPAPSHPNEPPLSEPSSFRYPVSAGVNPSYLPSASPVGHSGGSQLDMGLDTLQLNRPGSVPFPQNATPTLGNSSNTAYPSPSYMNRDRSSRSSRFGRSSTDQPQSPNQSGFPGLYGPSNRGDGMQFTAGDIDPVISPKMLQLGFSTESGFIAVAPGSAAEYALLYYALPFAANFNLPMHEQSVLDTLNTDARVHPSLLYTLYTIATYSLTRQIPFPPASTTIPARHTLPNSEVYKCVIGMEDMFYERAKVELERNIRTGVKLLDLAKASSGMSLYLLKQGRWVEAWCLPTLDLTVACGLHRISPKVVADFGRRSQYPPAQGYSANPAPVMGYLGHHGNASNVSKPGPASPVKLFAPLPFRSKVILSPPISSAIDLWERLETLWAAKEIDWGIASQFYWAEGLGMDSIESPWPLLLSDIRSGNLQLDQLEDPKALGTSHAMPPRPLPPRGRLFALQSLGLMMAATKLSDSPKPIAQLQAGIAATEPDHSKMAIHELQNGLQSFRERLLSSLPEPAIATTDPHWVYAQANLAVAEVVLYSERAVHQSFMYEYAVNAARRMVNLVRSLSYEIYGHLHCFVLNDISIVARFLYKESERLRHNNADPMSASSAQADADLLLHALDDLAGVWCPMGKILAEDVRRLKMGLPGKDGAFER